jgi:SNF2 family DNA or RNA helicase
MVMKKVIKYVVTEGLDMDELTPVNTHSKLTAIANHISEKHLTGSKLVFTHYRSEMDRLELLLRQKGITVSKLDGRTKKKARSGILSQSNDRLTQLVLNRKIRIGGIQKMILSYLMPDVLLIQIKSGCEGLNLQAYNNVYFTSPHWNPAVEDQAIGRAHRIGQTKPVNVYHFMTKLVGEDSQSLDEYCMSVQKIKRELMDIVSLNSQK